MVGSNTDHLTGWWLFSRRGQADRSLTSGIGPHDPELRSIFSRFCLPFFVSATINKVSRRRLPLSVAAPGLPPRLERTFVLSSTVPEHIGRCGACSSPPPFCFRSVQFLRCSFTCKLPRIWRRLCTRSFRSGEILGILGELFSACVWDQEFVGLCAVCRPGISGLEDVEEVESRDS